MTQKEFAEATNQSVEDVREKYSSSKAENKIEKSTENGIIKEETK